MEKTGRDGSGTWKYRFSFVVTMASSFLMTTTLGFLYTFGNLSPYVTSYLRNRTESWVDYTVTLWISQSTTISACIVMPLIGILAKRIYVKLYLLLGIFFHAAAIFGSYWAVQKSFWALLFTYGILYGFPAAFLYPSCVKICVDWLPERKGLISGVILMGYGTGSFAWTALTTWYINHDNLQPDLKTQQDVYYTQRAVLDKVPSCFLLLGTVFTSIQLLCLLLIRTPPPLSTVHLVQAKTVSGTKVNVAETSLTPEYSETKTLKADQDTTSCNRYGTTNGSIITDAEHSKDDNDVVGAASRKEERPEYSWRQVLKSRVFWTVWSFMFLLQIATGLVLPLIKAYAQTFIPDDHFLAQVSMASSIFNAVGRPVWGMMADRFGPRSTCLITQCLLAILVVTLSSCEQTGRVALFFWVCAMFFAFCGQVTMIPILVLTAFGSLNFNLHLGLLDTHAIIGAFIPALIAPALKAAFGWNGMFFVSFIALFIGILLNMSLDWFKCGDSIPRHMAVDLSIRR